MKHQDYLLQSM